MASGRGAFAADAPPSENLSFKGSDGKTLVWSLADLKAMPRQTVQVQNERTGKNDTYAGVPLLELLKAVRAPIGKDLRGQALTLVLQAEATDGYRAAFALGELDPALGDAQVLVADQMNGAPLDDHNGRIKLIVPRDKRPARSVRNLKAMTLGKLP